MHSINSAPVCVDCHNAGRKQTPSPWPAWAKALAKLRADGDVGVGDTVHRLVMGDQVEAMLRTLGVKCGCTDRRKWMNERFEYADPGACQ